MKLWCQVKGYQKNIDVFLERIGAEKPAPIPADKLFDVSKAAFEAGENDL